MIRSIREMITGRPYSFHRNRLKWLKCPEGTRVLWKLHGKDPYEATIIRFSKSLELVELSTFGWRHIDNMEFVEVLTP